MLTSIWRPQNAAPGGRCPPFPPLVTPLVAPLAGTDENVTN